MLNSRHHLAVSAGKILRKSLRFYCSRFNILFPPFLVVSLIKSILWKYAFGLIPRFEIQPGFTENFLVQFIDYLTFLTPMIISLVLISWMIDTLPIGLIVKYSSDILEGRPASLTSSLKTANLKILSLLLIGLIRGLLVILGLVLLIIPGIMMAVIFSLAIQVMIIERAGVFESLRRSRKLTSRGWWQVFAVLAFTFFLTVIAGVMGEMMCSFLFMIERRFKLIIISVIMSIVEPLQPVALTFLYYSLSAGRRLPEAHKPYPSVFTAPPRMKREPEEPVGFHPRFCFKCGQKLPSDAVYCPRCGVKVKT